MAGVPEHWEQVQVVKALVRAGATFSAVPNGGFRARREAAMLKAEGVQKGMPDLLIFTPPPVGGYVGVALEMKRRDGRQKELRDEQRKWLARLEGHGWKSLVGWGAMDALGKLRDLGYDV